MKIFVQIASYRDPQLIPTIENMLENAKKPKNLVIGIARQYSESDGFDNLDKYREDKRFRILDIPYQEAKGVCWARHLVQQLYDGETYTLQIDSHMRFVKDWDDILIKMIKGLQKDGYKKPLLTGYVPSFDPENEPAGRAQAGRTGSARGLRRQVTFSGQYETVSTPGFRFPSLRYTNYLRKMEATFEMLCHVN